MTDQRCPCGADDNGDGTGACWNAEWDYPWCRACQDHHRENQNCPGIKPDGTDADYPEYDDDLFAWDDDPDAPFAWEDYIAEWRATWPPPRRPAYAVLAPLSELGEQALGPNPLPRLSAGDLW